MKKTKFFLQTFIRSGLGRLIRISRFFTLLILVGTINFLQSNVTAQDIPGDNTSSLAAVTNVTTINNDVTALQVKKITGTVLNEQGDPLIGATVKIEGTTLGAITDGNGKFSLDVSDPNATLTISFIGFVTQQVPIAGKATIDVVLVPTVASLDEVVVIGYGTQKRTTLSGSVSVVKGEVVSKIPVANVTNALAGKENYGVITRQQGGQPGKDDSEISIRGIATTGSAVPLIVIDGIVRSRSEYDYGKQKYVLVSNLDQIDPSTIASVTVLKDAAAVAPYGMGGANGVILITTKSGSEGLPTLTFDTYPGVQTPTYYPNLLNAVDYMKLRNESTLNDNPNAVLPFDPATIANYASLHASDPDKYPDSNTKDLVNFNTPIQKHDLQISGGTARTKYFAGVGFFDGSKFVR